MKLIIALVFNCLIFISTLLMGAQSTHSISILEWNQVYAKSINAMKEGQYQEAILWGKKALHLCNYLKTKDVSKQYYLSYMNMAKLYIKQKNYKKAIDIYSFFLDLLIKHKIENELATISVLYMLTDLNNKLGEYHKAEDFALRGIKIFQSKDRKNTILLVNLYIQLALIYKKDAKYNLALSHYEKALTLLKNNTPPDYENMVTVLKDMANIYTEQANYPKAKLVNREVLNINEKVLGKKSICISCVQNLGRFYKQQRLFKKAERMYIKAIQIEEKTNGEKSVNLVVMLNSLGELYSDLGQYKKAEPYLKRALMITNNKPSSNMALTLNNLSVLYEKQGDYLHAEPLARQALKIDKKISGRDHPEVARDLNTLARSLYIQGKKLEALTFYKKSLAILKKHYPGDHPSIATLLNNIGSAYRDLGHYDEAEHYYKRSLEMGNRLFPSNNTHSIIVLENMVGLFSDQRKPYMALFHYYQAQRMKKRIYKLGLSRSAGSTNSPLENEQLLHNTR